MQYDIKLQVASVLLSICLAGVLTFFLLRPTPWADKEKDDKDSPIKIIKGSIKILFTPKMLLLTITFAYTGLGLSFWSGVYGTCIGRTMNFEDRKSLVGLHGIGLVMKNYDNAF